MTTPGIAIITYKRPEYLRECLRRIRDYTPEQHQIIVACNSDDDVETLRVCADSGVPVVLGINRGVVWNKNRGLYYFMSRTECDPILLLEDDAYPNEVGWLSQWVEAASRWQHVNYSHPALFAEGRKALQGDGSPANPHMHGLVTGQCTAVSRAAVRVGGYLDTRFRGYGHGHVEWSRRHSAMVQERLLPDGGKLAPFVSIHGGLLAAASPTFRNEEDVSRNAEVMRRILSQPFSYVGPWKSSEEQAALEEELDRVAPRPRKPGPNTSASKFNGFVDSIDLTPPSRVVIRGWAADHMGQPAVDFEVSINGKQRSATIVREVRYDVAREVVGAVADTGFNISIDAFDLSPEALLTDIPRFEVTPLGRHGRGKPMPVPKEVINRTSSSPVPDVPHMPEAEREYLLAALNTARCYLEYGTGGSTVAAASRRIRVIGVEGDNAWLALVREKIKYADDQIVLTYVDIGPTSNWGHPINDRGWRNFAEYAVHPWKICRAKTYHPDLVLIDGRFRVASFFASLLFGDPGTRILFDDYTERTYYHVVKMFTSPVRMVGRMAEFVVPDELDRDAIWLALIEAVADSR